MEAFTFCNYCKAPKGVHKCSKCLVLRYCSKECQRMDWKGGHKRVCVVPSASKAELSQLEASIAMNLDAGGDGYAMRMQQTEMTMRRAGFLAGIKGDFTVHSKRTHRLLPDNVIEDGKVCVLTYNDEDIQSPVSVEFIFLSPASCAQELYSLQDGIGKPKYTCLRGGLLYMFGETNIFWSLMVHYKATGRCLPPCPMEGTWTGHTLAGRDLTRVYRPFESAAEEGGASRLPPRGSRIDCRTKSYAAASFVASKGTHPCFEYGDSLPVTANRLPPWWLQVERLWNASMAKCRELQRAPCMFYCGQMGCLAGGSCNYFHDNAWKAAVKALRH